MKNILFIPCYNCQNQILRIFKKFAENNIYSYFSEILIINNCSTDNTFRFITDYFDKYKCRIRISLINNKENYGLGGSHKIAFEYACRNKFDNIIVLHGDDQANISDIIPILNSKNLGEYDCYLGARFMKKSKLIGYPKFRIFGNIVLNIIFSIFMFEKIYDLGSGLNLYNTRMLKNNFFKNCPNDLTFNYMMILYAKYYNHKIKFFPISWIEKDQISNVKILKQILYVLKMLLKFMFFNKKMFDKSNIRNIINKNYKFDMVNYK